MTFTIWHPKLGAVVDPRADLAELAQTCERDYATEKRIIASLREQTAQATRLLTVAVRKQTKALGEDRALLRCPKCGGRFSAWRTSHGDWAARCRRCAPKGKTK